MGRASSLSTPEKPSDGEQAGSLSHINSIRLKGKIDRVDLIFNDAGKLERLLVMDYKGKSRNDSIETIKKKMGLNLDCQLALYNSVVT